MQYYRVVEKFISINGEGQKAGQASVFIRLQGCNLFCSYCDTKWANISNVKYEKMTALEIYDFILSTGINNVTLTGGEPLLADGIYELLFLLGKDEKLSVEVETNGSILIEPFINIKKRPAFTLDYKLESSDMERFMILQNYNYVEKQDTIKFVCGSLRDLDKMKEIVRTNQLLEKCRVIISPVFKKIEPSEIVQYIIDNKLNEVQFQLQLHKIIWESNKRGV